MTNSSWNVGLEFESRKVLHDTYGATLPLWRALVVIPNLSNERLNVARTNWGNEYKKKRALMETVIDCIYLIIAFLQNILGLRWKVVEIHSPEH